MSYHVNNVAPVLPRLGRPSVGGLGAVLQAVSIEPRIRYLTANYGADSGAFYRACRNDPLSANMAPQCDPLAIALAQLKGDQLAFYKNCMASRPSDVPVIMQHRACFGEAQKLSAGSAPVAPAPDAALPAPFPSPGPASPAAATPSGNKWLWIGGIAVAGGLAFVLLRK